MSHIDILIPYACTHDAMTVKWLNSQDIRSTFGFQRELNLASHRCWVDAAKDTKIWAIQDTDLTHIGNVLLKINDRHHSGYFQIYIGESRSRGLGWGELALRATIDIAFKDLGLHRIWLHTFPDNLKAEGLYKKNGFVMEGVERDALFLNNTYRSQHRWSLLKNDRIKVSHMEGLV